MDFAKTTAEELLDQVRDENTRWEFKSASLLGQKEELKKMLGKQVSGFANTGGGHIVLGVHDKTKNLEPCEQLIGNTRTKDFLPSLVETSVDRPLHQFEVHPIPFEDETKGSIFVIEIGDSISAPHQSRPDVTYYWRLDGKTKPAPHFHLENLWNRVTKAVLRIVEVSHVIQNISHGRGDGMCQIRFQLEVTVENSSLQSATSWGVLLELLKEDHRWDVSMPRERRAVHEGVCIHGERPVLLPHERATINISLIGKDSIGQSSLNALHSMWENASLRVRAVSQNYVTEDFRFGWQTPIQRKQWILEFDRDMKRLNAER